MNNWLSTVLAVLVGGMLTTLSSWLADRRLTDRERERRREERFERFTIRRNDFQRETLLALQLSSQKLLRASGKMHVQDLIAFRKTSEWQKQHFSEGLSDEHLLHLTETMLLTSRVLDDECRAVSDAFRECAASVARSRNEAESEERMTNAVAMQQSLIARIGMLVREMDHLS